MTCCIGSPSALIRSRRARNRLPGEADPSYTAMRTGLQPGHLGNVGLLVLERQGMTEAEPCQERLDAWRGIQWERWSRHSVATDSRLLLLGNALSTLCSGLRRLEGL
jgi:hypothetical protein